ncbi:MAG: exopolysaccharide biosynthesis polyprenyl glycosylphosphotransferase [Sphingomonadales bacterium]|nr:exopolysaccharide biosynthesis polyprenyl glycosylphosphotransferase [Sphingomonadales bacterium]MBD3773072.1 exopolysaccharide biosynthesis polyprenyl glycosylphosphotransferase [Paracoccaceae bacterium]MBD3813976.1 exopolysaccharide biosynthesis polyprenyl glycosylphosphotransferase [Betaproteobacteria bacterium]
MNAPFEVLPLSARSRAPLVPSLERRRLRAYVLLCLADIAAILAGFALAGFIYVGEFPEKRAMIEAQLLLPLYLTIAFYQSNYSIRTLSERRFALSRLATALLISALLLNFFAFYTKSNDAFSRATFTLGIAFSGMLMAAARMALIAIIRRNWGPSVRNVLVLDDGGPEFNLPHSMRISTEEHRLSPSVEDPHALDRLGRYLLNQDQVIVTCPAERRADWAFVFKAAGVHGEVVSDFAGEIGLLAVSHYPDLDRTALVVSSGPLGLRARISKRAFDLVMAGGALVALSPVMLAVAVAIRMEDGGPVFFIQRRLGQGNRFFEMYKFRSMRVERSDADGNRSASKDDDRVTRVGRFLRRTSLDELPQLLNVVRGEMSVVGPRPHALGSQAGSKLFWEVDGRYWHRHSLKPGLTGLAQVRGLRGATEQESDLSRRLKSDLEYIAHWSLRTDLLIVFRTLRVLTHDRAF